MTDQPSRLPAPPCTCGKLSGSGRHLGYCERSDMTPAQVAACRREETKARHAARRAVGACESCPAPPKPAVRGGYCDACADKINARRKQRRALEPYPRKPHR